MTPEALKQVAEALTNTDCRITNDLENSGWKPSRAHIEDARNAIRRAREVLAAEQAKAPPDRERLAQTLFEHIFRKLQPRLDGKHTWATADEETRQSFRDEIEALRLFPVSRERD